MPISSFVDGSGHIKQKPSQDAHIDDRIPSVLIEESAKLGEAGDKALERLRWLLARGASPERIDVNGATPLSRACEKDALGAIRILVEAGADIERQDGIGLAPLMVCAMRGKAEAVSLLLALGAHPLREQGGVRKGATALHYAAVKNHGECAKILAAAGASFGKEMAGGATPLLLAHQNGGESIVSAFETDEITKLLDENPIPSEKKRSGGRGRL